MEDYQQDFYHGITNLQPFQLIDIFLGCAGSARDKVKNEKGDPLIS
jgi:hypothetical protein